MTLTEDLKKQVEDAYSAIEDLPEENFKLEGFKIILRSILSNQTVVTNADALHIKKEASTHLALPESGDWQLSISTNLGISLEEVQKLFYLDNDDSLRLVLEMKHLQKSYSLATREIAILLSAGRQAAKSKFDIGGTTFDIIRKECERYNVLNKKNFTSYLKLLKPKFQIEGNGQDQSIRVTPQGFAEATIIARKYLEETKK